MATFAPFTVTADCSACHEPVTVSGGPRLTSDRTPDRAGAVVFIEFDQSAIDRHAATHLTDEEAAA
jgi:hypothetical protein